MNHENISMYSTCAPLCYEKLVLRVLSLHAWQASWGQQIQEFAPRAMKQMPVQGHSEAPGRSSGAGHQQHPKPEKQDNQHILNQPRGSFPDVFSTCSYNVFLLINLRNIVYG